MRRGGFAAGVAVGVVGLEIEAEREHLDGLVPLHVEVEFSGLFPYFDEFCQHGFVLVPDFAEQFECLDGLALAYDADGVERAVNEESRFEQCLRVFANLYVGTILLGCTFQARGEVHGVAHHGVVFAHGRAHVARDDVARVDTDAHVHFVDGCGPLVALVFPLLAQFSQFLLHIHCRFAGALGVVFERHGRPEEGDDGVAFVLVERSLVVDERVGHCGQVFVQQVHESARVADFFGERGETADIGEVGGNVRLFAAEGRHNFVVHHFIDQFGGDVLLERVVEEPLFAGFVVELHNQRDDVCR